MDTRPRSSSRETPSHGALVEADPGVELVELDGVARRRPGGSSFGLLTVAAVGVGLAALLLRPGADAGGAANVSPSAALTSAATAMPTRLAGEASLAAEPDATDAAGAFRAARIDGLDGPVSIRHLWPLNDSERGDRFLALAERQLPGNEVESIFLTSETGERWSIVDGPVDGFLFRAGVLEGNQVLAIGRVPSESGWTWEQWTIASDLNWYPWEPDPIMIGFDDVVDVRHLTRNNFGWLAVVSVPRSGSGASGTRDEIRYSDDGKNWHSVADLDLGEHASVVAVVPNHDRFVLVTNEPVESGTTRITAWTSADRRYWEAHHVATLEGGATQLTGPEPWFPTELGPFALVGTELVDGAAQPRAWTSPDGMAWSAAAIAPAAGTPPNGVRAAAVGEMGLIEPGPMLRNNFAVAASGGAAWTSTDTAEWMPATFLPANTAFEPTAVAVLGGVVAVAGARPDGQMIFISEVFPSRYPGR